MASSSANGGIEETATERTRLLENEDEEQNEESRLTANAKQDEYLRWLFLVLVSIFVVAYVTYAAHHATKKKKDENSLTKAEIPIKNILAFELVPTPLTALNPDRVSQNTTAFPEVLFFHKSRLPCTRTNPPLPHTLPFFFICTGMGKSAIGKQLN